MQFRKLLSEDDAVSPVIGVILMVAITVILAAVIASFVLGLGGDSDVQPTTSLSFDYEPTEEEITVTVSSGDSLDPHEVYLRGEFADESVVHGASVNQDLATIIEEEDVTDVDDNPISEVNVNRLGGLEPDEEISSGQGVMFSADDPDSESLEGTDFDIVWDTGDDSATLGGFEGPES